MTQTHQPNGSNSAYVRFSEIQLLFFFVPLFHTLSPSTPLSVPGAAAAAAAALIRSMCDVPAPHSFFRFV